MRIFGNKMADVAWIKKERPLTHRLQNVLSLI